MKRLSWRQHLRRSSTLDTTARDNESTNQNTNWSTMDQQYTIEQSIAVEEIVWNFDVRPLTTPRTKVSQKI